VTAAAPCREGVSTQDEDDLATASSIRAAGSRRKNVRALVLLGLLNGLGWLCRWDRAAIASTSCSVRANSDRCWACATSL
jgi:hypothetical protein